MKHIRCLLYMTFIFLPSILYSQYLELGDIDIFMNGYTQIKTILDEYKDDKEDRDWVTYNGLTDAFSKSSEEYIKSPTNKKFNDLQRQYLEILNCKTPYELENIFKTSGWKSDGNKKFLTIILGWGFLYVSEEMEKQTKDIPKVIFKLFIEKYSVGISNVLKIFNEHDLDIINVYTEEIEKIVNNYNKKSIKYLWKLQADTRAGKSLFIPSR